MYFHALKDRHDFGNPVSEVEFLPENNEQNRVITFEEQQKYLSVAGDTLKDIAGLIVETGMRPRRSIESRSKTSFSIRVIYLTPSERRNRRNEKSRSMSPRSRS